MKHWNQLTALISGCLDPGFTCSSVVCPMLPGCSREDELQYLKDPQHQRRLGGREAAFQKFGQMLCPENCPKGPKYLAMGYLGGPYYRNRNDGFG